MKILGISLGTKNGNNDTMCRVALEECQKLGAEIEFIHLFDWDIQTCTGCVLGTGFPVKAEKTAVAVVIPAEGPSLGTAPSGKWALTCSRAGANRAAAGEVLTADHSRSISSRMR